MIREPKRRELLADLKKLVPNGSLDGEGDDLELSFETPDGMAFTVSLKPTYRAMVEDQAAAGYLLEVLRLKGVRANVQMDGAYRIGDPQAIAAASRVAMMDLGWIVVEETSFPLAVVQFYIRAVRRLMRPPESVKEWQIRKATEGGHGAEASPGPI